MMRVAEETPIQVALCLPTGGTVQTGFAMSLAALINYTHSTRPAGLAAIGIVNQQTSILPHSREIITEAALEGGFTHMLWIDSDMVFPRDTLVRLLGHRVECVGVNAAMRTTPITLTAEVARGERLVTTKGSTGLEKVVRMGFGVMLLETNAVRKIRKRPWFDLEWIGNLKTHRGEDFYFCSKLRKAGVELHVDQDLSKEIGHTGAFTFYPTMGET